MYTYKVLVCLFLVCPLRISTPRWYIECAPMDACVRLLSEYSLRFQMYFIGRALHLRAAELSRILSCLFLINIKVNLIYKC